MKKERVLIVTKFYYRRGGDCICALNLEKMLHEQGHEVAVFAMRHPENLPSPWSAYWPAEVAFSGGIGNKAAALKRTLGMGDVAAEFRRLLGDFRPDVVHLHNIHSYLSPVVAKLARRYGAKVVWTLHDYKLICPTYACRRNGSACELCFKAKHHVLATRCMKGSLAASAIAWLEAKWWSRGRLARYTDAFICPSSFMARKMEQGGFPAEKLKVLCNFIDPSMAERLQSVPAPTTPADYYCYVGRLSEEKGVRTLLKAASRLPYRLKLVGDGPLAHELSAQYAYNANIEFVGRKDAAEVAEILRGARLSVMPSECYENNPMGVIESLCAGTPVAGSRAGGIPELVDAGSGATYPAGDADALGECIRQIWDGEFDRGRISRRARDLYYPELHYSQLMAIYRSTPL